MIIKVKNLNKTYQTYERGTNFKEVVMSLIKRKIITVNALKGISFDVKEGEILGLLGPNGAGKSTAMKILSGVLFPTSGEVSVLNYTPWKQRSKYVANIGAIFGQKSQLIWDIPPIDSFYMNKAIYQIPNGDFNSKLEELTDLLEVRDIIKKPTRQLSLGQRMKCEFIMAMLHNPKIVFLDEPTIGLDVIAKERIRDFILKMNRKGVTFILTTHDLDDVERLVDRVILINYGTIVFNDSLSSLKSYLGNKKIVCLKTIKPYPGLKDPAVKLLETNTPNDIKLELDCGKLAIDKFINMVNTDNVILDLSIGELPIEDIIKELYVNENLA